MRATGSRGRRGTVFLLAATVASLAVTLIAGYLTRLSLIEANAWIIHTNEVKLAIDDCLFALGRNDSQGMASAEAKVGDLTSDNPLQQQNIARAVFLTRKDAHGALDGVFASMQREEDRLMLERVEKVASARTRSSVVFIVGAVLTLAFGTGAFSLSQAQRLDLSRQRVLLEAIIEGVDEGIIALSPSGEILAINAAARALWGASFPRDQWPADWRGVLKANYEDGSPMAPADGPLARAIRGEKSENVVYRVTPMVEPAGGGGGTWVAASAHPIRDGVGHIIAAVTTLRDISEQRANAERLRDQSITDELTGLLNRRGFMVMATERLEVARRTKAPLALLYADVNGLKPINDKLGHEVGDRVIQDAADVLRSVFREGDTVARIGGDEFVALLSNFAPHSREMLLERLTKAIRSQPDRESRPYRLSMSAGITFIDWEAAPSLDALLAAADRAMYERKRERGGVSSAQVRAVPTSIRERGS